MFNYITVDNDGVITGVSQLAGVVERENMFLLDGYADGLLGKRRISDGVYEDVETVTLTTLTVMTLEDKINLLLDMQAEALFGGE